MHVISVPVPTDWTDFFAVLLPIMPIYIDHDVHSIQTSIRRQLLLSLCCFSPNIDAIPSNIFCHLPQAVSLPLTALPPWHIISMLPLLDHFDLNTH
jgi:hypothetical protein